MNDHQVNLAISKTNHFWLRDWQPNSNSRNISLEEYIKKLSVYYPKNRQAIAGFTLSKQQAEEFKERKEIVRRVAKRYKGDILRHIAVDISSKSSLIQRNLKNVRSLKLIQSELKLKTSKLSIKKLVKSNKNIQSLEISNYDTSSPFLVNCIKYIKSLDSLIIINAPDSLYQKWKKILARPGLQLENLTIAKSRVSQAGTNVKDILHLPSELPFLKCFRFDDRINTFDLNDIPFHKFSQNHVNYDLRISHTTDTLNLSESNISSLRDLDFLGINTVHHLYDKPKIWQSYPEEHIRLQKQAKNLLFLNLDLQAQIDFSSLIRACNNITMLDLSLGDYVKNDLDFSCLQQISKLKHLFLSLHEYKFSFRNLFENLTLGAQANNSLESVILEFVKTDLPEDPDSLISFFAACANKLTKLIVKFDQSVGMAASIDDFYTGISKLKSLKFLDIMLDLDSLPTDVGIRVFGYHCLNLTRHVTTYPLLEEFYFNAPIASPAAINYRNFKNLKNLQKLGLSLGCRVLTPKELQILQSIPNLKQLEFDILEPMDEDEEEDLLKCLEMLKEFKGLEIIKVLYVTFSEEDESGEEIKRKFKAFFDQHESLKLAILKNYTTDETSVSTVFVKDYLWADVDRFFNDNPTRKEKTKTNKICFY